MKTTIKSVVLMTIAFTLFVSCHQEKTTEEDSNTTDRPIIKKDIDYDSYKIENEDEAIVALKAYKDYIELVKESLDPTKFPDNSDKLNYGSESFSEELIEILVRKRQMHTGNNIDHITDDDKDRLFLMNAIRPKLDKDGNKIEEEVVTEIIYVLQSEQTVGTKTAYTHTYFDFTRPCPTGCPTGTGIEYPTEIATQESIK